MPVLKASATKQIQSLVSNAIKGLEKIVIPQLCLSNNRYYISLQTLPCCKKTTVYI